MVDVVEVGQQIATFIADGYSLADIRGYLAQQYPNENHKILIDAGIAAIEKDADRLADSGKKIALDSYRRLFRDLRKIGDFSGALRAVQAIEKLTTFVAHDAETQQEKNLQRILRSI